MLQLGGYKVQTSMYRYNVVTVVYVCVSNTTNEPLRSVKGGYDREELK
jgi:hypothetical protein